jgi:HAD superfamily hydrolase (TIGR01490 family)
VPAAYFDVDGTLVGTNLVHPTVMYLANQANPYESVKRIGKAVLQAPIMLAAEMRDRRLFNEMLFAHYQGMSEDRLRFLAEEVFEAMVKPRIFRGTPALLESCKRAGFRVVLVTGALDVTIAPLARYLGVADAITNRLEMKNGYATGKLLRPVVAGPGKARILADDAREHGDDLAECQAYSDSFSDVPMLSVVGHPQCINPDPKLARLARAYHWPILDIERAVPGDPERLASLEKH